MAKTKEIQKKSPHKKKNKGQQIICNIEDSDYVEDPDDPNGFMLPFRGKNIRFEWAQGIVKGLKKTSEMKISGGGTSSYIDGSGRVRTSSNPIKSVTNWYTNFFLDIGGNQELPYQFVNINLDFREGHTASVVFIHCSGVRRLLGIKNNSTGWSQHFGNGTELILNMNLNPPKLGPKKNNIIYLTFCYLWRGLLVKGIFDYFQRAEWTHNIHAIIDPFFSILDDKTNEWIMNIINSLSENPEKISFLKKWITPEKALAISDFLESPACPIIGTVIISIPIIWFIVRPIFLFFIRPILKTVKARNKFLNMGYDLFYDLKNLITNFPIVR